MEPIAVSNALFALILSMALSMVIIPIMWRVAPVLGMIDKPDTRKVHTTPIPRVGGWGVVLGALLPVALLVELHPLIQSYLIGSLVLFAFGSWDDVHETGHYTKFVGQIIAVAVVVAYGGLWIEHLPVFGPESTPAWLGISVTFFSMIGMINAINHSDGLDGLAGGEALLSLIVIIFLAYIAEGNLSVLIGAATAGGILGFLRYNTHPARVFMGDTGSQFLGFTLAFLAIVLTQQVHTSLSPAIVLLFLGLPVIDIVAVLFLRIRAKRNWFRATRNHIHHRLLDLGFDHYETVVIIYSIQTFFVVCAIFFRYESDLLIMAFYCSASALIFTVLTSAERRGWRRRNVGQISGFSRLLDQLKGSNLITRIPLVVLAIMVSCYLLLTALVITEVPRDFGLVTLIFFILMVADLIVPNGMKSFVPRSGVYIACIFSAYLADTIPTSPYLEIAFFLVLTLTVILAARFCSDFQFQTTPMDYLIVFGILTIVILSGRYFQLQEPSILLLKGIVLLYGCELLIDRTEVSRNPVYLSSVLTLGVLALRGLLPH